MTLLERNYTEGKFDLIGFSFKYLAAVGFYAITISILLIGKHLIGGTMSLNHSPNLSAKKLNEVLKSTSKTVSLRKPLSRKTRFEILKRDLFKCSYCGKNAEEGKLHVDHVIPVALGGTNDIMNLVTACEVCNLGKKAIPLDDRSVASKARHQAEDLHEQKETLVMMAEWRASLRDLDGQKVDHLVDHWKDMTPGFTVSDSFKPELKNLLKKYSFDEISKAMDTSAQQYLKYDNHGQSEPNSIVLALNKIKPILKWKKRFEEDPILEELLYIRGIARKRCPNYFPAEKAMEILKQAREEGVSIEGMTEAAKSATNFKSFDDDIHDLISIAAASKYLGSEENQRKQVLHESSIVEETKIEHLKKTSKQLIAGRSISDIRQNPIWICDACCNPIYDNDGMLVQTMSSKKTYSLNIVHTIHCPCANSIIPKGSEPVGSLQYFFSRSPIELADLLLNSDLNSQAVIQFMKRCYVPGYELAQHYFASAIKEKIIINYRANNCFYDWQIDRILAWLGATGPFLPAPSGCFESNTSLSEQTFLKQVQND